MNLTDLDKRQTTRLITFGSTATRQETARQPHVIFGGHHDS
jgi:hypothetical protein